MFTKLRHSEQCLYHSLHFMLKYIYKTEQVRVVERDFPVSAKPSVVIGGVLGQSASSSCGCRRTVFGEVVHGAVFLLVL